MSALEIFDPRLLPQSRSAWKQCNGTYGAKEMEVLCAEFGKVHVTTPITKQKQRSACALCPVPHSRGGGQGVNCEA